MKNCHSSRHAIESSFFPGEIVECVLGTFLACFSQSQCHIGCNHHARHNVLFSQQDIFDTCRLQHRLDGGNALCHAHVQNLVGDLIFSTTTTFNTKV